MNRMERLTGILLLLQNQAFTSEQIASHFEISRRTVLRDIQALCELGIPIVAVAGPGGGYSLADNYLLAPLPLNARETFLLLLALSVIARLPSRLFEAERNSLVMKLRALLPEQNDLAPMLSKVEVEIPERQIDNPFLERLFQAMQTQSWVQVSYQSTERRSTQRLFPRRITTEGGYWYCRAYSAEHQQERTYRVDRIRDFAPVDEPLQPMAIPASDALPYDHESHPLVTIRLTARGVALFESDPHLGHRIRRNADETGEVVFRCPPGELTYFARLLAGFGADAEVDGPPDLRERLLELGQTLTRQYQNR